MQEHPGQENFSGRYPAYPHAYGAEPAIAFPLSFLFIRSIR